MISRERVGKLHPITESDIIPWADGYSEKDLVETELLFFDTGAGHRTHHRLIAEFCTEKDGILQLAFECKNMSEATMRVSQVDPDNDDVRCVKYKYTYPICIFTEHIIRFTDACTARWSAPDQVFPVNSLVVAFYNDVLEYGDLVSVREEKANEW